MNYRWGSLERMADLDVQQWMNEPPIKAENNMIGPTPVDYTEFKRYFEIDNQGISEAETRRFYRLMVEGMVESGH